MGNEMEAKPIYPGTLKPQQNKDSSTAGKMTGTMILIMKEKEGGYQIMTLCLAICLWIISGGGSSLIFKCWPRLCVKFDTN